MNYSIGDKIFDWTVISEKIKGIKVSPNSKHHTHPHYIIKCKCGHEMKTRKSKIVKLEKEGGNRTLQKCCKVCLTKEKAFLKKEQKIFGIAFSAYKSSAKTRNLDFNLDINSTTQLFKSNCTYCNLPPYNKIANKYNVTYTGLDRIDSSKGYIKGNVQACCKQCNIGKLSMTHQDYLDHIKRIYDFSIKGSSTIPQGSTFK